LAGIVYFAGAKKMGDPFLNHPNEATEKNPMLCLAQEFQLVDGTVDQVANSICKVLDL
jgi:hypothetical protein